MLTTLFWKKTWVWIKHHWYLPALVILLILLSLSRSSLRNKLYKLMANQRDLYEKEKKLVTDTSLEKELEKEKARTRHEELERRLDEQYKLELTKLDEDKQKELSTLVEKYENNESELAKRIAEALGAEYVPAGEGVE